MLLLFETAAGFALFKVLKEGKLEAAEVGSRRRGSCAFALTVFPRQGSPPHLLHFAFVPPLFNIRLL